MLAVLPVVSESPVAESDQKTALSPMYTSTEVCKVGCCLFEIKKENKLPRLPLTRAFKGFFLQVQTCVLVDVNQPLPWFFRRWSRADSFPVSRALGKTCLRLSPFCNIFATESGTASCPDYEEYKFIECLSEETQIIDLFTHSKLQPRKLSQCTLAARLSSY